MLGPNNSQVADNREAGRQAGDRQASDRQASDRQAIGKRSIGKRATWGTGEHQLPVNLFGAQPCFHAAT
ncbi:unnamed protein product, partial [Closterium sp. Yama58-4]